MLHMASDRQLEWIRDNRQYRQRHQPIGALVWDLARHAAKGTGQLESAQALWDEEIGAGFHGLAFPSALCGGILEISVTTPAAKFAIEQEHRNVLLEQFRSQLGSCVQDIRCVLQPLPSG